MNKSKRNILLVILSLTAGLMYLTPFLRFSFYDQMMEALNITDIQIGTIGGIYGFFSLLGYLPSGYLADKFSAKIMLTISTLGMCLCTIWYSMNPGFLQLCIIHALYGIFSVGTFWAPYIKAIRNLGNESEQGRLFGMSEGIRGIGQTAVAFTCLWVIGASATAGAGFRYLLLINAAAFALLMLAIIFLSPKEEEQKATDSAETKGEQNVVKAFITTLKSSSTWICTFVVICGFAVWTAVNGYMGTYTTRVLNLPAELSSTLSIIRSFFIVFIAGFSGGFIIDKFRTKGKGLFVAFCALLIGIAAVFLTAKFVMLCVVLTVVLAYLVNVIKATYWSIMGEAGVSLNSTGMATGVISLIAFTPDIFTSPIIGRFLSYGESQGNVEIGFNLLFLWIAVWAVLGIASAFILQKRAEKNLKLGRVE